LIVALAIFNHTPHSIRMKRLFALLSLLLITACDTSSPVTDDWAEMPRQHKPALWEVTKGQQKAYLFGSIHALPKDIRWFSGLVADHFTNSDVLVMEIDAAKEGVAIAEALNTLGSATDLKPVKDRIDPKWHDEFAALQESVGLSDGALAGKEDWAAALTLAGAATTGLKVNGRYGVETILGSKARGTDKAIIALETAAIQFGYFDRLPASAQKFMLEGVIAEADNAKNAYRSLLKNWLTGDVAALNISARAGMMSTTVVRQSLLVERNRDWHHKIITMMANGQQPFIAVGAAHLAGPDSVQQMLSEQGYTINRLQ